MYKKNYIDEIAESMRKILKISGFFDKNLFFKRVNEAKNIEELKPLEEMVNNEKCMDSDGDYTAQARIAVNNKKKFLGIK